MRYKKRYRFLFIILLTLLFALVGCGNDLETIEENEVEEATNDSENEELVSLIYPDSEKVEIEGIVFHFTEDGLDEVLSYYGVQLNYEVVKRNGMVQLESDESEQVIKLWIGEDGINIEIE